MADAVEPILLTVRDAARALALSERTLWTLTQRGELPAVRIGRAVRYIRADLEKYASGLRRVQTPNGDL